MKRAQSAAYWIFPSLFCLVLYWYGLKSWFRADDFAWLGLGLEVSKPSDLWRVMFEPKAQGTIRPLSERAYFMGLYGLFGLDALPFRIVAFLTQFASLALLSWITLKLTGSRVAGFFAPILWAANSALVIAMTWSSAYNQLLCGFFLLLAFALFLKYEETKRSGYYWCQFVAFLLGFGALEINVVYPALVASYLIPRKKPWLKLTLPLFACSLLFTIVHLAVAPRQTSGAYVLYFDSALPATLATYWKWVLVPYTWWNFMGEWDWRGLIALTAFSGLLIGFPIAEARRRRWIPLLFLCWFVLLLAPILPLRHHISDYYLTLPAMAAAGLGATAFAASWRRPWVWRIVGVACLAVYLAIDIPETRYDARWFYEVARSVKIVVLGVAHAHELHPNSTILLANVDDVVYNHGIADGSFRLFENCNVFLTPQSGQAIEGHTENSDVSEFVLPPGPTLRGLADERIVVYEPLGDKLKNITEVYERMSQTQLRPEIPRRVDVGSPLFAYLLGPEWYPVEATYRWMPRRATLRIGGPNKPGQKLIIHGICPRELMGAGQLGLTVSVDGEPLPRTEIDRSETLFDRSFSLPPSSAGKKSMELTVEVSRSLNRPEDGRELGLAFGVFVIR